MVDINITLLIQMGNFLLALLVINFLIIKPIRAALQRRRDVIGEFLLQTQSVTDEAEKRLSSYEAELEKVRTKAHVLKEELRKKGQDEAQAMLGSAQQKAHGSLQDARKATEAEASSVLQALRSQVDTMAGRVSEKLVY